MKHKYSKNNKQRKNDIDKISNFYKAIDSTIVEYRDCREIFDNAVEFKYNQQPNEYYENDINAIMINNIRHNCSNYDTTLNEVNRIRRTRNDYIQYKNSILEKIAYNYPFLRDGCEKQKRKLDMVKVCKR